MYFFSEQKNQWKTQKGPTRFWIPNFMMSYQPCLTPESYSWLPICKHFSRPKKCFIQRLLKFIVNSKLSLTNWQKMYRKELCPKGPHYPNLNSISQSTLHLACKYMHFKLCQILTKKSNYFHHLYFQKFSSKRWVCRGCTSFLSSASFSYTWEWHGISYCYYFY